MEDSTKTIEYSDGLHLVKRGGYHKGIDQLAECQKLLSSFEDAYDATLQAIPHRLKDYRMERLDGGAPKQPEAIKERIIWEQWGHTWDSSKGEFLPSICKLIQTYQLPLPVHGAPEKNKGWGAIDLVGVSPIGNPVIIELKSEQSGDPILIGIIECIRYSIALKEMWAHNNSKFVDEWEKSLKQRNLTCPNEFNTCDAICLAENGYWEQFDRSDKKVWDVINQIIEKLKAKGIRLHFAKLNIDGNTITAETFNLKEEYTK